MSNPLPSDPVVEAVERLKVGVASLSGHRVVLADDLATLLDALSSLSVRVKELEGENHALERTNADWSQSFVFEQSRAEAAEALALRRGKALEPFAVHDQFIPETPETLVVTITVEVGALREASRVLHLPDEAQPEASTLRHQPRRSITGDIEIVDTRFDFVRCILPYNYAYTSNSQQSREADRICQALEGPMSALGIVQIAPAGAREQSEHRDTPNSSVRLPEVEG